MRTAHRRCPEPELELRALPRRPIYAKALFMVPKNKRKQDFHGLTEYREHAELCLPLLAFGRSAHPPSSRVALHVVVTFSAMCGKWKMITT